MSDPYAIEVEGLSFSYGSRPVLIDVNFTVPDREFVSVVGPNGGGKTTLVRLLLGLLAPDAGTVRVLGSAPRAARSRVGYLAQTLHLDPKFPVTTLDVALMGRLGPAHPIGPFRRADRSIAMAALAEVGMADLAGRPFATLSGGQRQRVLIARALACEPEILMLDEPTAGLDQRIEASFYELMAALAERLTVVLVSHDLGFVSRYVRRAICVNGRVHVHPTDEIDDDVLRGIFGSDVRLVRHDREAGPDGSGGCGEGEEAP